MKREKRKRKDLVPNSKELQQVEVKNRNSQQKETEKRQSETRENVFGVAEKSNNQGMTEPENILLDFEVLLEISVWEEQ